jgi:hypothetical protein
MRDTVIEIGCALHTFRVYVTPLSRLRSAGASYLYDGKHQPSCKAYKVLNNRQKPRSG